MACSCAAPHLPSVLISGAGSGCGKTTVSLALMAACRNRGFLVRPFKTGPDFIDPGWHAAACGLPSLNLDPWMQAWKELPGNAARQFLLHPRLVLPRAEVPRGSVPEIAIIEGAMGLYDGLPGLAASAADVALELHVPLLLVIDVRGMAASAAAVARGLAGLRPGLAVAGALCVMAGSVRHEKLLRAAFAEFCPDIPLLGVMPRTEDITLPSRHLGLTQAGEFRGDAESAAFFARLAELAESHIDLDALFARLGVSPRHMSPSRAGYSFPGAAKTGFPRIRIALARDEAFSFWYPESSLLLEEAGAELVPFSPLHDAGLPPGSRGLILPGGYPELHAERLSANVSMREAIRVFACGHATYGECGGFLYLMDFLEKDGTAFPMCGCLPLRARMEPRRAALGYREARGLAGPWENLTIRGHEFHYSRVIEKPDGLSPLWELRSPAASSARAEHEGAALGCISGSYVHLSMLSHPDAARCFVARCLPRQNDLNKDMS